MASMLAVTAVATAPVALSSEHRDLVSAALGMAGVVLLVGLHVVTSAIADFALDASQPGVSDRGDDWTHAAVSLG